MNLIIMKRNIKLIKRIVLVSLFLFIGCEDKHYEEEREFEFVWTVGLPQDDNGLYHLTLDRYRWQTLHRLEGLLSDQDGVVDRWKVYFESNLYWHIGDTMGYYVHGGLSDDVVWVAYDTTYITHFVGHEVRTSNYASYSDDGEVVNMIAPVRNMIGDTLWVGAQYNRENWDMIGIVLE